MYFSFTPAYFAGYPFVWLYHSNLSCRTDYNLWNQVQTLKFIYLLVTFNSYRKKLLTGKSLLKVQILVDKRYIYPKNYIYIPFLYLGRKKLKKFVKAEDIPVTMPHITRCSPGQNIFEKNQIPSFRKNDVK